MKIFPLRFKAHGSFEWGLLAVGEALGIHWGKCWHHNPQVVESLKKIMAV